MFNVGVGFMLFGLMLWLFEKLPLVAARERLETTATIVGYKQFPSDETITDSNIARGPNFRWLRVVQFKHPKTGQTIQMYSNPGVANPEPIGTSLVISFNPNKIDSIMDFVWVKGGMRSFRDLGLISLVTGFVVFIILLFVPKSSPLQFILIIPAFLIVFVATYISIWKRPNQ